MGNFLIPIQNQCKSDGSVFIFIQMGENIRKFHIYCVKYCIYITRFLITVHTIFILIKFRILDIRDVLMYVCVYDHLDNIKYRL